MQQAEETSQAIRSAGQGTRALGGFAGVCLVVIAAVIAYWPTVSSLLAYWNNYANLSYTHGYLIAAICAWLTWRARARIDATAQGFSPLGLAALLALSVAWAEAYLASIEVAHQALLPLLLLAAIASFAGWRTAVVMLLPVGYLYFAIPVWDQVNGLLQQLTVVAVTLFLKLVAVPAWFTGNYVHLGVGTFEIAGGCSGLHFFIVANAIAVLYGEMGHDTIRTRIKLVLIAAGMALVMNWIRVATIIVAGYLTDMQSFLVRVDHYYFGWALFGVLLALYFWGVPKLLGLKHNEPAPTAVDGTAEPVALRSVVIAAVVTLAGLAAMPALVARAEAKLVAATSVDVPAPAIAGWLGPLQAAGSWRPQFAGADDTMRASYRNGTMAVEAFAAYFASQSQGKEIGGYGSDLLAGGDWTIAMRHTVQTAVQPSVEYQQLAIADAAGDRWVVGYYYEVGGRTFTNDVVSKLYYPLALLQGRPASRVIAAAVRCDADCGEAEAGLARFLADGHGALQRFGSADAGP